MDLNSAKPVAETRPLRRVVLALIAALATLAVGLSLATRDAGEWQPVTADPGELTRSFATIAREVGIDLEVGQPSVRLATDATEGLLVGEAKHSGEATPRQAQEQIALIEVTQTGVSPEHAPGELVTSYTFSGRLLAVHWNVASWTLLMNSPASNAPRIQSLAVHLLAPHEPIRWGPQYVVGPHVFRYATILPAGREHLSALAFSGGSYLLHRQLGGQRSVDAEIPDLGTLFARLVRRVGPFVPIFLLQVATFMVLLFRRRIDIVNGGWLAALVLVAQAPVALREHSAPSIGLALLSALWAALWILVTWSTGESVLRSSAPDFTTSLDALRRGRLGPRAGRSLLVGLATGTAIAGLNLVLAALVADSRALWSGPLVSVPLFETNDSPFAAGIRLAAVIMLLLGFARRFLPPRWGAVVVTVLGAVCLSPAPIHPFAAGLAVSLVVVGILVTLCRRWGLTALLSGAVTLYAVPAAALAAWHQPWMAGSLAATAIPLFVLVLLALISLGRPERIELERMEPPAFVRRLEEERRLRYEMNLLARMQLGLLPTELPQLNGWAIAARSVLATEASGDLYDFLRDDAGRLWVAAGDVAGHGYSCSIVQAMTTAALSSLIGPDRKPSQVLAAVDRVLRRGGTRRNFTSLALLRLDLGSGEAQLSNAGHPPPWLVRPDGEPEEQTGASALPLGQGPPRVYTDLAISIPRGASLVFCSDGVYEATDGVLEQYGYDRPRAVLARNRDKSAASIVNELLADCERHRGGEAPQDDTTVVVIKRLTVEGTRIAALVRA